MATLTFLTAGATGASSSAFLFRDGLAAGGGGGGGCAFFAGAFFTATFLGCAFFAAGAAFRVAFEFAFGGILVMIW